MNQSRPIIFWALRQHPELINRTGLRRKKAPKKLSDHDHERLQKAELKRQKKREKALKHKQGGEA